MKKLLLISLVLLSFSFANEKNPVTKVLTQANTFTVSQNIKGNLTLSSGTPELLFHTSVPYGVGYLSIGHVSMFSNNGYGAAKVSLGMRDSTAYYPKLTILKSGYVGIGIDAPTQELEVSGDILIDNGGLLYLRNPSNDATASIKDIGATGTNKLAFRTGGSDRAYIDNAGSVGIGVASPEATVHIYANAENKDGLYIEKTSDSGNYGLRVLHSSTSTSRYIADFQNTDGSVMLINAGGRVGIGTELPAELLHVSGNIKSDGIIKHSQATKTTAYTASTEEYLFCDGTTAGFSITLPAVSAGLQYTITKTDAITTHNITVDGNSSETIDGELTQALTTQYDAITIVSNGTTWFTL